MNLFTPEDLKEHLTEDGTTVCIAGSLDVAFGQLLTSQLSSLYSTHPTVLFGMPTWWDVTDFTKPEFKGVEVIYTTPFYTSDSNALVAKIVSDYKTRFYSRPYRHVLSWLRNRVPLCTSSDGKRQKSWLQPFR